MNNLIKPMFEIGDAVYMYDDFHFNPIEKVVSIGVIEAIHIYKGKRLFAKREKSEELKQKSPKGRIVYKVSGFSLMPEEKDLILYKPGRSESLKDAAKRAHNVIVSALHNGLTDTWRENAKALLSKDMLLVNKED